MPRNKKKYTLKETRRQSFTEMGGNNTDLVK